jgi:predicted HicB family RNase H-like nuclease
MQAFQGDRVQLATRIPHALHRAIRLHAIEQSTSLGAFVTEALVEHLARCQQGTDARRKGSGRRKSPALPRAASET